MQDHLAANKSALKNFLLAFAEGDVDRVSALVTDDFKLITMGSSFISGTRNRDELCELINLFDSVTNSRIELRFLTVTAEDDRVSCEMESYANLVNGNSYNNLYHLLAYMRDGRIYLLKEYLDTKYADAALGGMLKD